MTTKVRKFPLLPGAVRLPTLLVQDLLSEQLWKILLVIIMLVSAFSLILVTHKIRNATANQQQLESERLNLDVEWRKLRLEQSALGEHSRIENIAKSELEMRYVKVEEERVVKP